MKSMLLAAAIVVLAIYVVYLQFQVNGLQDVKLASVPVDDTLTPFDGGPFVPVDTPVGTRAESTVSASILEVENSASLVAESATARDIGEFISADPLTARPMVESEPRLIGAYRGVDDETPHPEALAEPRNIGEYMPVKLAGG